MGTLNLKTSVLEVCCNWMIVYSTQFMCFYVRFEMSTSPSQHPIFIDADEVNRSLSIWVIKPGYKCLHTLFVSVVSQF